MNVHGEMVRSSVEKLQTALAELPTEGGES